MSDTQVQAMHTLHKNLVSFFDELIDMFPSEGDFVVYRILVKDRVPMTEIVNYMSMYLLPEKDVSKQPLKMHCQEMLHLLMNGLMKCLLGLVETMTQHRWVTKNYLIIWMLIVKWRSGNGFMYSFIFLKSVYKI